MKLIEPVFHFESRDLREIPQISSQDSRLVFEGDAKIQCADAQLSTLQCIKGVGSIAGPRQDYPPGEIGDALLQLPVGMNAPIRLMPRAHRREPALQYFGSRYDGQKRRLMRIGDALSKSAREYALSRKLRVVVGVKNQHQAARNLLPRFHRDSPLPAIQHRAGSLHRSEVRAACDQPTFSTHPCQGREFPSHATWHGRPRSSQPRAASLFPRLSWSDHRTVLLMCRARSQLPVYPHS